MLRLLSLISKNFIIAIPVMLVLGFVYGLVAPTTWLTTLIITPAYIVHVQSAAWDVKLTDGIFGKKLVPQT